MFANINASVFVSLIVDIDGDELHNRHLLCYTSDVASASVLQHQQIQQRLFFLTTGTEQECNSLLIWHLATTATL